MDPQAGRHCYLDYHISIQAVTLACPGVDYIRLWPVTQPWEDPADRPETLYLEQIEAWSKE